MQDACVPSFGLQHLRRTVTVLGAVLLATLLPSLRAQKGTDAAQYPAGLLGGLAWRDVGPMRGGRTYAVAGSAAQPDTFYMGSVGGGVWKTENAGRTWFPIADTGIPIGSIGAIAVAPSDPNVVYVGTGEPDIRSQHSYGIGMFKSTDAGRTWKAIGLEDSRQIGRIVVDPANANVVYVAALGHVYDANPTRGVFRSTDGGTHWKKVLFDRERPDDVGAVELAIDASHPKTLYASLWGTRRPPWSVYAPTNLPGGGLWKSTDAGDTWIRLGGGLPNDAFVGKIGIAIAPSNPNRLWAVVDDLGAAVVKPLRNGGAPSTEPQPPTGGGVYTSNDAGATWKLVNSEQRLWGRGWYFESVAVDPRDPDRAYVINTGTYETRDGGKTFVPVKGSPGGDDDHQLWINPRDGDRMVLSTDQGTVVSVDGAQTWSTWYNQPTAQIYHVAASSDWPYHLYGAQQDSGAVGVSTWSPFGVLDFRNWEPLCLAGESNTVVPDPDPAHARVLWGGGAASCDQSLNVALNPGGELPAARARRSQSQNMDAAGSVLPGRRSALLLQPVRVSHPRPRQELAEDQPGPDAHPPGSSEESRPGDRDRHRRADDRPLRRRVHAQPVAARREDRLGRHRRWSPAANHRRRRHLDRRDAARDDGLEQGVAGGGRALRPRDGLRFGGPAPPWAT